MRTNFVPQAPAPVLPQGSGSKEKERESEKEALSGRLGSLKALKRPIGIGINLGINHIEC